VNLGVRLLRVARLLTENLKPAATSPRIGGFFFACRSGSGRSRGRHSL
jgi:hypothetical protein